MKSKHPRALNVLSFSEIFSVSVWKHLDKSRVPKTFSSLVLRTAFSTPYVQNIVLFGVVYRRQDCSLFIQMFMACTSVWHLTVVPWKYVC
jgi:hypothetical protein